MPSSITIPVPGQAGSLILRPDPSVAVVSVLRESMRLIVAGVLSVLIIRISLLSLRRYKRDDGDIVKGG